MVVATTDQLSSTYLSWRAFTFPDEHGPKFAYAVPTWVANQLNAAYTIMLGMLLAQFWSIVMAVVIVPFLHRHPSDFHFLSANLWNGRTDLLGSLKEVVVYTWKHRERLWLLLLLSLLVLIGFAGETAAQILVPPLIILGHAAPVNPAAIYAPDTLAGTQTNSTVATWAALEAPWSLRALGGADLTNPKLREKVLVSNAINLGTAGPGNSILQVDYSYAVTGADFGLQHYPQLTLTVNGSCKTDYSWYNGTNTFAYGTLKVAIDYYNPFGDRSKSLVHASLFDGAQPLAFFLAGSTAPSAFVPNSNSTWGIIPSSVNRSSFSPGTDPWYLTAATSGTSSGGAAYTVQNQRPVLSCWESDVWSNNGKQTTIVSLTSDLGLPSDLQDVLQSRLAYPKIADLGSHLGPSSLLSGTTAVGTVFDASGSSLQSDLERLVLAAYIATANVLTDLTLYPVGSEQKVPNIARNAAGGIKSGVTGFVVWSPDVAALSLTVVIVIPSLLVFMWLLSALLLFVTPLSMIHALRPEAMYEALVKASSELARPQRKGMWHLGETANATASTSPNRQVGNKDEEVPASVEETKSPG